MESIRRETEPHTRISGVTRSLVTENAGAGKTGAPAEEQASSYVSEGRDNCRLVYHTHLLPEKGLSGIMMMMMMMVAMHGSRGHTGQVRGRGKKGCPN